MLNNSQKFVSWDPKARASESRRSWVWSIYKRQERLFWLAAKVKVKAGSNFVPQSEPSKSESCKDSAEESWR